MKIGRHQVDVLLLKGKFALASRNRKEPIPLDQENPNDEEKVDYKANIDVYFTKPDNVGFEGNMMNQVGRPWMGWLLHLFLLVANLNL
ncbi:uncharacterized protein A4U43_C04F27360 [Asparagus officinalis]|uniref:Uncharacterized protein n=1 Tax=Asparagus officinalis TaxID=4686 RepID=A0A5P1F9A7_ASPOF|nr:uncharacterized protein A4U43_C04F27360 [Asparagus officinalis]